MSGKIYSRNVLIFLSLTILLCLPGTGYTANVQQLSPTQKIQQPIQTKQMQELPSKSGAPLQLAPPPIQKAPQIVAPQPVVITRVTGVSPRRVNLIPGSQLKIFMIGSNLNRLTSVKVLQKGKVLSNVTAQLGNSSVTTSRELILTADSSARVGECQIRLQVGSQTIDLPASLVTAVVSKPETTPQAPPSARAPIKLTTSPAVSSRSATGTGKASATSGVSAGMKGPITTTRKSESMTVKEATTPTRTTDSLKSRAIQEQQRTSKESSSGSETDLTSRTRYKMGSSSGAEGVKTEPGIRAKPMGQATATLKPELSATQKATTPYRTADTSKAAAALRMQGASTEGSSDSKYDLTTPMETARPSLREGIDEKVAQRYNSKFAADLDRMTDSRPSRPGDDPSPPDPDGEITVHYRPKGEAEFSVKLVSDFSFSEEAEFSSETIPYPIPDMSVHVYFPSLHSAQIKLDTKIDLEIIYPKIVVPGEEIRLYPKINYLRYMGSTPALQTATQVDYDFGVKFMKTEEGAIAFNTKNVSFLPSGLLNGNKTVIPHPGQVSSFQPANGGAEFLLAKNSVQAWRFPKKDIVHYVPNSTYIDPFYDLYIEANYTVTHDAKDTLKVLKYYYSFDQDPPGSNSIAFNNLSNAPLTIKIPDNRGLKAGDILIMHFDKIEFENIFQFKVIADGNAEYYGEICALVWTACTEIARVDIPMNNKTIGNWTKSGRLSTPVDRRALSSMYVDGSSLRFEIVDSVVGYID